MEVRFLKIAEKDLIETTAYLNQEKKGLGQRFAREARSVVARFKEHPQLWMEISKNLRRARLNHFPSSIFYRIDTHEIIVAAILHDRQNPSIWQEREDYLS